MTGPDDISSGSIQTDVFLILPEPDFVFTIRFPGAPANVAIKRVHKHVKAARDRRSARRRRTLNPECPPIQAFSILASVPWKLSCEFRTPSIPLKIRDRRAQTYTFRKPVVWP